MGALSGDISHGVCWRPLSSIFVARRVADRYMVGSCDLFSSQLQMVSFRLSTASAHNHERPKSSGVQTLEHLGTVDWMPNTLERYNQDRKEISAGKQCSHLKDHYNHLAPANQTQSTPSFRLSCRVLDWCPVGHGKLLQEAQRYFPRENTRLTPQPASVLFYAA